MKKLAILIGILAVLGLGTGAGATLLSGSIQPNSGLTSTGNLYSPLTWSVTPTGTLNGNVLYKYEYTWIYTGSGTIGGSGYSRVPDYIDISLSSSANTSLVNALLSTVQISGQYYWDYTKNTPTGQLSDATWYNITNDPTNGSTTATYGPLTTTNTANYPTATYETMNGIRFNFPGDGNMKSSAHAPYYNLKIGFTTTLAPEYGDVFIWSGSTTSKGDLYAYDTNWAKSVATVGSATTPVPIPGAVFLFAPGLAALVAVRRRKQK